MAQGGTLDLFAPRQRPEPQVLTVTQLNNQARTLLEDSFAKVLVAGEVSNYKVVSGHHYFTLKDRSSQLSAVLFRREAQRLKFSLKSGMEVVLQGRLTVYGAYGRYQIVGRAYRAPRRRSSARRLRRAQAKAEQSGPFCRGAQTSLAAAAEMCRRRQQSNRGCDS